jgi:hypothetical protein
MAISSGEEVKSIASPSVTGNTSGLNALAGA